MPAAHRSHRLALLQTALVSTAFAMQLVISNAINPLLPIYRAQLDLSAMVLSLTFVLYVSALVLVLSLLANPRFARHAPALLLLSLVALVALVASDLFALHPEPWSILTARVLVGVAGGPGTGAASALVVGTIGAAGRSITSTGNIAGAGAESSPRSCSSRRWGRMRPVSSSSAVRCSSWCCSSPWRPCSGRGGGSTRAPSSIRRPRCTRP